MKQQLLWIWILSLASWTLIVSSCIEPSNCPTGVCVITFPSTERTCHDLSFDLENPGTYSILAPFSLPNCLSFSLCGGGGSGQGQDVDNAGGGGGGMCLIDYNIPYRSQNLSVDLGLGGIYNLNIDLESCAGDGGGSSSSAQEDIPGGGGSNPTTGLMANGGTYRDGVSPNGITVNNSAGFLSSGGACCVVNGGDVTVNGRTFYGGNYQECGYFPNPGAGNGGGSDCSSNGQNGT